MKKHLLKISLGITGLVFGFSASAQCPTITCPSDITINASTTSCDTIVTFTAPEGNDLCASGSQTFSYTGAQEFWVVPAGVTLISVDAYGAQGGANWGSNVNYGGQVQADITVTPGDTLYINVGEQPTTLTGGFNGGGTGEGAGIGGGGASDIRIGGTTLNDRVIVAGGAGGAGYWSSQHIVGGLGGGLIAGAGYRDTPTNPGGDPGTQSSSGNGTCGSLNNPIVAGGLGFGGSSISCGCEGYGGGGGYYGGGGSGNCRGGGGGSSYAIPTATNLTHTQGVRMGHGEITISYAGAPVPTTQTAGLTSGSTFPVGITTNTYSATNAFGTATCSFTVTVIDACVGINENRSLNNVSIYPNPTNGLVNVNLGNHNGSIKYTISTIEGRIVKQESNVNTNSITVDLSNESKGIYFLKLEDKISSNVYKIIRK
jgi:hypothetical protein